LESNADPFAVLDVTAANIFCFMDSEVGRRGRTPPRGWQHLIAHLKQKGEPARSYLTSRNARIRYPA
ncbi:hypothetical protein ACC692_37390, partial [Rhizobium ruizarguesonis]